MDAVKTSSEQQTVRLSSWLCRVGVAGFMFFLLKGLAWGVMGLWLLW